MFKKSMGIIAAGWLCLIVASCGPRAGQDVNQVIRDAQHLSQQGKVDKALDVLTAFHKSRHYEKSKAIIFRAMLQLEVDAGRLAAAEARFNEMVTRQPAEAAQGVGVIEDYLTRNGRHEAVMAWCDSLKAGGLGDEIVLATVGRHVQAAMALGRTGEVARIMGSYLPILSEPAAIGLVNRMVEEDVRNSQWSAAEQKIAALETGRKDSPAKRGAAALLRVTLLLAHEGGKAAGSYLRVAMKTIPDDTAARILQTVVEVDVATNDLAEGDALCEAALAEDLAGQTKLRETAATCWLSTASKQGDPAELIRRMAMVREKKVAPSVVVDLVNRYYVTVLGKGNADTHERLNTLCEGLRVEKLSHWQSQTLDGMLLDLSYYRKDYEGSLKILDRGIVQFDPDQRAMLVAKIHAHMALGKGQTREAVGYFREFMRYLEVSRANEIDPVDQSRVSTEMILGLNAKRIAELLSKDGDAEGARKAYAQAKDYYGQALKEFPEKESKENRRILKELNSIPAP